MKKFKKSLCVLMSVLTLAGSAYAAGFNSFASEAKIEVLEIDDSNPFDFEHYINEPEEEKSRDGIRIEKNCEKNTKSANLPSSYDSRDYGYVAPVRSQGQTGTCWAHATMSALESYEIKYHEADAKKINISEAHLTWFALNPNSNGANSANDGTNLGTGAFTNGGNWRYAALALANHEGANNDADYPISDVFSNMAYGESERYSQTAGITVEDAVCVSGSENIKSAIMNNGSVTCSFYYNKEYLNFKYISGVSHYSYYCPSDLQVNHSVTIVGWDDNYSKDYFKNAPANNGAWLMKDSWGDASKENGYFWMSYEDATLSQTVSWSAMDTSDLFNNYSHTSALFTGAVPNFNAYASVYTAKGFEKIDNIGLFNLTQDASVTVSVYRNLTASGTPESGTLAGNQTRYLENEGYYTFYIGNILLNPGERFAVVVSISSTNEHLIPVETERIGSYTCEAKESYVKTSSGWFDLSTNQGTKIGNTYIFVNTTCGHNFETVETPATCTNPGACEVRCAQCGYKASESVIPATGHHFRSVSSGSDGSNTITYTSMCDGCGAIETETYIKGTRTITFVELIQRIFEMFFTRLGVIKAGDKVH